MHKSFSFKPFLVSFILLFWVVLSLWVELYAPKLFNVLYTHINHALYDTRLIFAPGVWSSVKYPIVIVTLDTDHIRENEELWSYNKIALLISKIRAQGSIVIASDIIFRHAIPNNVSIIENKLVQNKLENSNLWKKLNEIKPLFDDNISLIEKVQFKNDIVLSFLLDQTMTKSGVLPEPMIFSNQQDAEHSSLLAMNGYISNFPDLQKVSSHNGFVSIQKDVDGVMRRWPIILRYENQLYASLPLEILKLYLPNEPIHLNFERKFGVVQLTSIQIGKRKVLTDKYGQVLIPFYNKNICCKHYAASAVLNHELSPGVLKNSIVFLSSPDISNLNNIDTPIRNDYPTVEIHANILHALLSDQLPYSPPWQREFIICLILGIGIFFTLIYPKIQPRTAVKVSLAILSLITVGNLFLWIWLHLVLEMASVVVMTIMQMLTLLVFGFVSEHDKKNFIKNTFSQYIPKDHIAFLLEHPDTLALEGKTAEMTVLFSDIRKFTTFTEKMDVKSIKNLLNQFFTPITSIILKHGGTIDKYVGDSIIAFWGAPIKNPHHREAAINAALEMMSKSQSLIIEGAPKIRIGVGINTGLMNVGDMGSEFRRAYTVLGDAVNLGSRLESATKYYGVNIIVGSNTAKENKGKFLFRWLDRVRVKGKKIPNDIYEVICRMEDATSEQKKEIKIHHQALAAYCRGNLNCARTLFSMLNNQYPRVTVYKIFLSRIKRHKKKMVLPNWTGIYTLRNK